MKTNKKYGGGKLVFALTLYISCFFSSHIKAEPLSIFTCPACKDETVVVERNQQGDHTLARKQIQTTQAIGEIPLDLLTAALCKAQGYGLFLYAPKEKDLIAWQPGQVNVIEELTLLWNAKGYCVSEVDKALFIYRNEDCLMNACQQYSSHCETRYAKGDLLLKNLSVFPGNLGKMRLTVISLCKVEANQAICCLKKSVPTTKEGHDA